jgi:hypothetical protein
MKTLSGLPEEHCVGKLKYLINKKSNKKAKKPI